MLTPSIASAAGTPIGRPGRVDTLHASINGRRMSADVYFKALSVKRISEASVPVPSL